MLITKPTVRFKRFTPAMLAMLNALYAADLQNILGQPADLVITSANDSTHSAKSRHYTDEALDVRSKSFVNEPAKWQFQSNLRAMLGPKFTVLYEGKGTAQEHWHIQPKKGTVFP